MVNDIAFKLLRDLREMKVVIGKRKNEREEEEPERIRK